jgi:hypothetical protein
MIENIDSFLYLVSQFLITALPVAVVIAIVFFGLGRASGKSRRGSQEDVMSAAKQQLETATETRKALSSDLDKSKQEQRDLTLRLEDESRQHRSDLDALREKLKQVESELTHSRRQLEEQRNAIHDTDQTPKTSFWRLMSPETGRQAANLIHRLTETEQRLEIQTLEAQVLKDRISAASAALASNHRQDS